MNEGTKTMIEARIINRGRGPEIEGTRITVYDVLDYHEDGWHRDMIADIFDLSSAQVEVAIRYIDEHRDEVMAVYQKMLERDRSGESPRTPGEARRRSWKRPRDGAGTPRGQGAGGTGCGAFWRELESSSFRRLRRRVETVSCTSPRGRG